MRIRLVVGDWSRDGHNQSDDYYVEANLKPKALQNAYQKGCKIVGFDLIKECCHEYEENGIQADHTNLLAAAKLIDKDWYIDEDGILNNEPEIHVELFMKIAKLGNPSLEYTLDVNDETPEIHIGGYGLYHS